MLVEPDVLGRRALAEEQKIGLDAGVWGKYAIGQADDGVQIAVFQQLFLDACFDAFAEEEAVRQNQCGTATGFEHLHDQH